MGSTSSLLAVVELEVSATTWLVNLIQGHYVGGKDQSFIFFWSFVVRSVVSPNSIHLTNSVDSVQFPLLFEHN